jgi:hypothetical protein
MTDAVELGVPPASDIKAGFSFLYALRAPRASQGRAGRGKLRSSIECATQGHGRCRGIACGCACHCGDGFGVRLNL